MTPEDYEAEIKRLRAFAMQLAEKLAAASEVLAKIAERKEMRSAGAPPLEGFVRGTEESP